MIPSYLKLSQSGELNRRTAELNAILEDCTLCPHECRVNRLQGETGICEAPGNIIVSSCFPHYGEEPELVGQRGSGTIFLSRCNLRCVFCQNDSISHGNEGETVGISELADIMLRLQGIGCHNINFVTPTHYTAQITGAVALAAERGLTVPLVYNSSGYDSVEILQKLDGIFDIYMPDTKFSLNEIGRKFTEAEDYSEKMFAALTEMYRQTGVLKVDSRGIAERGMLIRHLVMPGDIAGSKKILEFLAEFLSKDSYVNIMGQYRPSYKAYRFKELSRPVTSSEVREACEIARGLGLHRGF
jgi:putative pyruvate formate lyase activating enzyme